ncbi:MAG: hypothetical protein HOW97_34210 [Catenulispora sp.]|nr:hypothetical protein [Catenulispora sp.]
MAFFGLFGNDRAMASSTYSGRESASDKATRKQRERGSMGRGHRNAADADRAGKAWERRDRRRFGG